MYFLSAVFLSVRSVFALQCSVIVMVLTLGYFFLSVEM